MKKTERFRILREQPLSSLFTIGNLVRNWRTTVRAQMRDLDIKDLHDYYDFNANIGEKASEIRNKIIKAQYRASSPLIYRVEKKYGICRRLMVPSPSDALVFQTIAEYLYPLLKKVQPTDKAFYSRDKHQLKLPHQFKNARASPWFVIWPKFQKQIWKFTDDCAYIVETDVTDFFDNIGLRELRNIVSSHVNVPEVIYDLLFNVIEQLAWTPDYLPTSLKGLPTINVEAFRLLPHVMLFEIDKVLDADAHGNFVRWMDDINIGVDSKEEAFGLLGSISDVLKSRGLALNISKTNIYTSSEAKEHFMVDENTFLDEINSKTPADFAAFKRQFISRFRVHLKQSRLNNWDKVTKRYFTIAGHFMVKDFQRYAYKLFLETPSVRSHILAYLATLGFSKRTASIIQSLMHDLKRYDDITLFEFVFLVTNMEVPRDTLGLAFIKAVGKTLSAAKTDFDLYCYLWFLAKYGEPQKLMNFIFKTEKRWRNEQFLARQVVSVLPRLFHFNSQIVDQLLEQHMVIGPQDAASVATNIHSLKSLERIAGSLYPYLFPGKLQKPYPLPKYLILTTVLSSAKLKPYERTRASIKIQVHISDPWYLHWLKRDGLVDS